MAITPERIGEIGDEAGLFKFLREELGWPLDEEPQTYEFYADELGLPDSDTGRVESVRQMVNFSHGQPWGIFLVKFRDRVDRSSLRRVLRGLSETRRDRDAELPAWKAPNLLFISTPNYRDFSIARFDGSTHTRAVLSVFGWEHGDTSLRTLCEHNLKALIFPADPADSGAWLSGWAQAFSVQAATDRFFAEYKLIYESAIQQITEIPGDEETKILFTQRLFNRLMFIHFLSKKGWLEFSGRKDYLHALWEGRNTSSTFYDAHLLPLFFAGLNNPAGVDVTSVLYSTIGMIPYLNGGLFEKDPVSDNKGELVPDSVFDLIFNGLFRKFNFTVSESTPLDIEVAVDPEMLGKVFEKLMNGRKDKGAFYTPRSIVSFMCRESLKGYLTTTSNGAGESEIPEERIARLVDESDDHAVSVAEAKKLLARLTRLKVVDPACGSGAYLLGMMQELFLLTKNLDTRSENGKSRDDYDRKLAIIENNLYGVDLDPFAVNITMLRLWLSLIVDYRESDGAKLPALPNLDFKIERGNSLTAPDPATIPNLFRDKLIEEADKLKKLKARFFQSSGGEKQSLREQILEKQTALLADLQQRTYDNDSFEWRVQFAEVFKPETTSVSLGGAMNFGQELAEADVPGGFHIVIANPPYGVKVEDEVRFAYFDRRTEGSQSKDTYGLFMARALQLLCDGGQFCFIVSDTWRTIKSHRPLRARLLAQTSVRHVIDLPDWVFEATVNTGILSLTKRKPQESNTLIAGDLRGIKRGDWQSLEDNLRTIAARGVDVQTLSYARYTYPQKLISTYNNLSFFIGSPKLYSLMNDPRFQKLGKTYEKEKGTKVWSKDGLCMIISGIKTGDNSKYVRRLNTNTRGSEMLVLDPKRLMTQSIMEKLTSTEILKGVNRDDSFVPLDKGGISDSDEGWLPNYWVESEYYIDWSTNAVAGMNSESHSDMANVEFRFKRGITYSRTGAYAPTFRLSCGGILESKSCGLFTTSIDVQSLLAIICSNTFRYFAKCFAMHSVESSVGTIGDVIMPIAEPDQITLLATLSQSIIDKQKANARYQYYLYEQKEIDALVYQLYGLDENDIREVEFWFCRRYPRLAMAQGAWTEAETKYTDYLQRADLLLSKPPGYWRSHPVYSRIAEGEGQRLDFKRFLASDLYGNKSDSSVESVLKEIAGFLNAEGGTILIGVTDGGEIVGIGPDLAHVNRHNEDGFEQKLRQLMETRLSPNPHGLVDIRFEPLPEGVVCVVDIAPAPGVTYFTEKVYLRDGNRTAVLEGRRLVEWLQRRSSRIHHE